MNRKNREQLLLLLAAVTLGLLAGDRLVLTPLMTYYQETAEKILFLDQSLQKGKILLSREQVIRDTWRDMRQSDLPESVSAAENQVLKSVDAWINDSRIELLSFKPQWNESGENFITLECFAVAQGNLEEISRFLYELETDELSLHVENMELSDSTGDGSQLRLNIRFSGIRIREEQT